MDILHFTPGSLTPAEVRDKGAAHLPLASGDTEVSCLYLPPGGQIAVAPSQRFQLLLMVNGRAEAMLKLPYSLRSQLSGGTGTLLHPGEHGQLSSVTGAILIAIESERLVADPCGISLPERVMGQLWPTLESN